MATTTNNQLSSKRPSSVLESIQDTLDQRSKDTSNALFKIWHFLVEAEPKEKGHKKEKKVINRTLEIHELGAEIAWLISPKQVFIPGLPTMQGWLGSFFNLLNSGKLISILILTQAACLLGLAVISSIQLGIKIYNTEPMPLTDADKQKRGWEKASLYLYYYSDHIKKGLKIAGCFLMAGGLIVAGIGTIWALTKIGTKFLLIGYAIEAGVDFVLSIGLLAINTYKYFHAKPEDKQEHLDTIKEAGKLLGYAIVTGTLTVISCVFNEGLWQDISQSALVVIAIYKIIISPLIDKYKKYRTEKTAAAKLLTTPINQEEETLVNKPELELSSAPAMKQGYSFLRQAWNTERPTPVSVIDSEIKEEKQDVGAAREDNRRLVGMHFHR